MYSLNCQRLPKLSCILFENILAALLICLLFVALLFYLFISLPGINYFEQVSYAHYDKNMQCWQNMTHIRKASTVLTTVYIRDAWSVSPGGTSGLLSRWTAPLTPTRLWRSQSSSAVRPSPQRNWNLTMKRLACNGVSQSHGSVSRNFFSISCIYDVE